MARPCESLPPEFREWCTLAQELRGSAPKDWTSPEEKPEIPPSSDDMEEKKWWIPYAYVGGALFVAMFFLSGKAEKATKRDLGRHRRCNKVSSEHRQHCLRLYNNCDQFTGSNKAVCREDANRRLRALVRGKRDLV